MKLPNGSGLSANAGGPSVQGPAEELSTDSARARPESLAPENSENRPHTPVEVGDVWWIPEQFNGYPGGKDRFCLVVGLETSRGLALSGRVHFIPGSTKPGRTKSANPEIVFQAGEAGLPELTYFSFWFSSDLGIQTLTSCGRRCGKVDAQRLPEIRKAIAACRRPGLKRVASC
jgi:hypothetical protein